MEQKGLAYSFTAKLWYSEWYFVSLPKVMAKEIRVNCKCLEEGWGRLKAIAKIGASEWKTAIWFDTSLQTYLLPVKADIRKKERIGPEQDVTVTIWI